MIYNEKLVDTQHKILCVSVLSKVLLLRIFPSVCNSIQISSDCNSSQEYVLEL